MKPETGKQHWIVVQCGISVIVEWARMSEKVVDNNPVHFDLHFRCLVSASTTGEVCSLVAGGGGVDTGGHTGDQRL